MGNLAEHAKWASAYEQAMAVAERGELCVLLGPRGNGKTQCAVEIIRMFCRRVLSCLYVRSREVGMRLRQAYGSMSTLTEIAAVRQFQEPHLLVIDECQERPDRDFELRSFTLILDRRYGALRPTILIANCTPEQFATLMGGSVTDRLKEGGGIVPFDWPSFRTQALRREPE